MKKTFALLGILCFVGATFLGLTNWFLVEFYLEKVDWEGPAMVLNKACWVLNILLVGGGGVFVGLAAMSAPKPPGLPQAFPPDPAPLRIRASGVIRRPREPDHEKPDA